MTLASRKITGRVGSSKPRLAPLRPARSDIADFRQTAASVGIDLMAWQDIAGTYLTALGRGDRWLYREVAVIVARQNGKTELLVPFIVSRLLKGRRIMHTAQNRELPREVFGRVADLMEDVFPQTLKKKPRFGAGQETIEMLNGGKYRIVAPSRGGARGPSNDDVIVDELREMNDYDFIAAAKPTLAQSANPQIVYLSNAGEDDSIVLNDLRLRIDEDPSLAYLEWSAAPDRDIADRSGWLQANPAVGAIDGHDMMQQLEQEYRAYSLTGRLSIFETEHLCRWVPSMRERLVDEYAWAQCRGPISDPLTPMMAVSMTPDGRRAAAALAWQRPDGSVALRLIYDVTGDPIDTGALGADLVKDAAKYGVRRVAYDPLTDAELAKFLKKPEKVAGQAFANASAQFVNLVNAGRLKWQDDGTLTSEVAWTSRKAHDGGHFEAVRMADDHPIPAVLASIRAVWLASGPQQPSPRVY
jgi:hypothetical protein